MKVLNAMQLKAGAKSEDTSASSSLTQPIQFLSSKKKEWWLVCLEYRLVGITRFRVFKTKCKKIT